jgi:hypothetical protein
LIYIFFLKVINYIKNRIQKLDVASTGPSPSLNSRVCDTQASGLETRNAACGPLRRTHLRSICAAGGRSLGQVSAPDQVVGSFDQLLKQSRQTQPLVLKVQFYIY